MNREKVIGLIIVLLTWYVIYWTKIVNPLFLPAPHVVLKKLIYLLFDLDFLMDIGASVLRILISFVFACLIGIPIGLIMGYYRKIYNMFEFIIEFFRALPALALFPLLIFFFGIGNTAKIATAIISCSLIIIINSIYGVINGSKTRRLVAYLMEAKPSEIFWKVIFMDALPHIVIGLRISLSLAIIIIIVTEMFVGTTWGIGHRIYDAQLTYRVSEMYSSIIVTGVLGYSMNKLFIVFEKKIVHWV